MIIFKHLSIIPRAINLLLFLFNWQLHIPKSQTSNRQDKLYILKYRLPYFQSDARQPSTIAFRWRYQQEQLCGGSRGESPDGLPAGAPSSRVSLWATSHAGRWWSFWGRSSAVSPSEPAADGVAQRFAFVWRTGSCLLLSNAIQYFHFNSIMYFFTTILAIIVCISKWWFLSHYLSVLFLLPKSL